MAGQPGTQGDRVSLLGFAALNPTYGVNRPHGRLTNNMFLTRMRLCEPSKAVKILPGCKRSVCGVASAGGGQVGAERSQAPHTKPGGIPANIPADRLRKLQAEGIVDRAVYQQRPRRFRYHLTDKGKDLLPVLRSMVRWANKHVPGTLALAMAEKLIKKTLTSCKSPS